MVFVAGKHITDINEFSQNFQAIIQLIRNGYNWLQWALNDPSLSVYYAQTEQDLLTKIQSGLHETLILKCQAFMLHIDKAMAVEDPDLDLLTEVFQSGATQSAAVKSLQERYGLVTNAQIRQNSNFLSQNQIISNPPFYNMSLQDELEFWAFRNSFAKSKKTELKQEALSFALGKASTSSEFVHYVKFYMNCVKHQLDNNVDGTLRPQQVEDIYMQLAQLSYSLIYVPNIGKFDSPQDLAAHLPDFVMMSKFIGYRITATAMENLAKNIQIAGVDEEALKNNIENYMTGIKNRVSGEQFTPNPVPQDGWLSTFTLENGDFEVVIQVDPNGDVFLSPQTGPNA